MAPDKTATLGAAGWKLNSAGLWESPLTRRAFPEKIALVLAAIKPRAHQNGIYRPKFTRRATRA